MITISFQNLPGTYFQIPSCSNIQRKLIEKCIINTNHTISEVYSLVTTDKEGFNTFIEIYLYMQIMWLPFKKHNKAHVTLSKSEDRSFIITFLCKLGADYVAFYDDEKVLARITLVHQDISFFVGDRLQSIYNNVSFRFCQIFKDWYF